jgi:histidinol-phosphate aminotransferase
MKISKDVLNILKKLEKLDTYPIPSLSEISQKYNVPRSEIIRLNANENFFIPKSLLKEIAIEAINEINLNIYPENELYISLKNSISNYIQLKPEYIALGNGSDDLINLLIQIFVNNKCKVLTITPTFSMYKWFTIRRGGEIIEVPLNKEDFSLNVQLFLSKISKETKICFICSPNNPTGNQFKIDEILKIIEGFPGIVVIDEAYVEYADYSLTKMVDEYENLIILRTFSKAFGLASIRLGYAISNPYIIKIINKFIPPFHLNSFSLAIALKALSHIEIFEKYIRETIIEREFLINNLKEFKNIKIFDSKTNFILIRIDDNIDKIFEHLLRKGIIVRNLSYENLLSNCLRVTIGTREMNEKFLLSLKEVIK